MTEKDKTLIIAIIIIIFIFSAEFAMSFIDAKETLADTMFNIANNVRLIIVE